MIFELNNFTIDPMKIQITDTRMDSNQSPIFVLIHGTFSKGAEWTKRGSKLYEKLRMTFPTSEVVRFTWDGKNSHKSRTSAAQELEALVDSLAVSKPKSQIFLIAHSHGGNIALYASRHFDCRSKLAGIICMGTPFVIPSKRLINAAYFLFGLMVGLFGAMAFGLCLILITDSSLPFRHVLLPVLSAVSLMGVVFIRSFQRDWTKAADVVASKIMEHLELTQLQEPPLLSIHSPRDEAFRVIGFAKLLHAKYSEIYHRVAQPFERLILYLSSKKPEKLLIVAVLISLSAFPLFLFPTFLGLAIMAPVSMFLTSAFCCLGIWAIALGLITLVYPLVCVFLRVLGPEFLRYGLFVNLEIDLEPWKLNRSKILASENGRTNVDPSSLVLTEGNDRDQFGELIHTRIYKDDHVVDTILNWVNGIVRSVSSIPNMRNSS